MYKRFFNYSAFTHLGTVMFVVLWMFSNDLTQTILGCIVSVAILALINRFQETRKETERDMLLRIARNLTTVDNIPSVTLDIHCVINKVLGAGTGATHNSIILELVRGEKGKDGTCLGAALDLAILWNDGWEWFASEHVDRLMLLTVAQIRNGKVEKTAGGRALLGRISPRQYPQYA